VAAIAGGPIALGTVGVMAPNDREVAHLFHDATKHSVESVSAGGHFLDFANMPIPLKHYPDLEPISLPVDLPERDASAVEVLSGRVDGASGPWGLPELARVLFFSAGVTRRARMVGGRPIFLRAAASAGALYPIEVYVVCGDMPGLPAGVYHFDPVEFAMRQLRDGDHRLFLARAAVDGVNRLRTADPWCSRGSRGAPPRSTGSAATDTSSGMPVPSWRTGWRSPRLWGSRRGCSPASSTTTCPTSSVSARPEEYPLVIVPLAAGPAAGRPPAGTDRPPAIDHRVHPLSPSPQHHKGLAAVHQAGVLDDADEVTGWRTAAAQLGTAAAHRH
jgi:hypothetical protein